MNDVVSEKSFIKYIKNVIYDYSKQKAKNQIKIKISTIRRLEMTEENYYIRAGDINSLIEYAHKEIDNVNKEVYIRNLKISLLVYQISKSYKSNIINYNTEAINILETLIESLDKIELNIINYEVYTLLGFILELLSENQVFKDYINIINEVCINIILNTDESDMNEKSLVGLIELSIYLAKYNESCRVYKSIDRVDKLIKQQNILTISNNFIRYNILRDTFFKVMNEYEISEIKSEFITLEIEEEVYCKLSVMDKIRYLFIRDGFKISDSNRKIKDINDELLKEFNNCRNDLNKYLDNVLLYILDDYQKIVFSLINNN